MPSTIRRASFQRKVIKALSHLKERQDNHHMNLSFVRDSTNFILNGILVGAWR
jgi:hypothetical protein